jgi:hypothetical protein
MAEESKPVEPREVVPAGTSVVREGFNAKEIMSGTDLATGVDFKTQLEAAMILAKHKPRSLDKFRLRMLDYCKDPAAAAGALYRKPVGKAPDAKTGQMVEQYAVNFSVRFDEAALQAFGNTRVWEWITYEDSERARIHVLVIDVEDNNGYGTDRMIEKVVERKNPGKRPVRRWRANSFGDQVALVDATADEFRNLWGAERSKLRRDNAQRLLPYNILAECRAQIEATLKDQHAQNPAAARNKIVDAFHTLGITPEELTDYLGKKPEQFLESDLAQLREIYTGLRDGEFTWAALIRLKEDPAEGEGKAPPKSTKLKDQIIERHEGKP